MSCHCLSNCQGHDSKLTPRSSRFGALFGLATITVALRRTIGTAATKTRVRVIARIIIIVFLAIIIDWVHSVFIHDDKEGFIVVFLQRQLLAGERDSTRFVFLSLPRLLSKLMETGDETERLTSKSGQTYNLPLVSDQQAHSWPFETLFLFCFASHYVTQPSG